MLCRVEKCDVLRIGPRPPAFDVMSPKRIQLFSDSDLVVHAKRNPLGLRAIAQGSIIDHDLFWIHISKSGLIRYPRPEEFARASYSILVRISRRTLRSGTR